MKDKVKAVILVGGQGTRLRPLTYNTPKPMVPVLNLPFLEHVIRNLKEHDITEIVMAQHYLAESMKSYFGDGSKLGVKLHYVMEDTPRGTAGAVKNAAKYLDGTFVVLNGDIFHNRDFTEMLKFHRRHKAKVTIVLTPVEDPTIYGVVETDQRGKVKRFLEKPKAEEVTTNMINAGTYVLEPEVLQRIPSGTKHSFEREVFPRMLMEGEPVYAYPSDNYWMDTGTPEKYLQLHRDLLSGKCDGYSFVMDVSIGAGCNIHPSAQLSGRVIIGDNSTIARGVRLSGPAAIGPHCTIQGDAVITDSVIWHSVKIGQRAIIKSSIVADNCTIGDDSYLIDAVLGDHVMVNDGVKLKPGSRIMPGE
ncbi:MAG: NDP-sugar synthase, partial [Dehalococcoidales bacterium]|nr:NDP-sugar synthase [Dehalococcoidales bacterium]